MKVITAYVCEFCPKRRPFKSKSSGSRHEKNCYRNPETRSCVTCKHFTKEEAEPEVGIFGSVGCEVEAPGFLVSAIGQAVETRLQTRCSMWELLSSPAADVTNPTTELDAARKKE